MKGGLPLKQNADSDSDFNDKQEASRHPETSQQKASSQVAFLPPITKTTAEGKLIMKQTAASDGDFNR